MSRALLHVTRNDSDHALLNGLESSGVRVIEMEPEDAANAAEEADAAVIASDVDAPVRIARAIHNAAPHAHIVFMTTEETEPALRRELLFAPRIGTHWSVARADAPAAAEEAIRNALEATLQRRNLRTTINRMNLRLVDRNTATPRLIISDHFYGTVLQQLSDGVILLDTSDTVLAANDAARAIFGDELRRGVRFVSLVPSEVAGGGENMASVITVERESGPAIVEVRQSAVRNERGTEVGRAILARDVTERRAGEERQRLITEATLILSATLDLTAAMQSFSEFLAHEFSTTAVVDIVEGDTVTRRGAAVIGDRPELAEKLRRFAPAKEKHPGLEAFRTGKPVMLENLSDDYLRSISRDEEHFELVLALGIRALAVVPIAAGQELIGAITLARTHGFTEREISSLYALADVTARTVQNIWLYHAAEQANRAKEEFLATLSHELRTPMTAVLGWIQLMRAGGVDEQMLNEGLQAMEQSARAQAQLIDDLLDLSRVQMGKLHLQMQTVIVENVVRAAVETVRPAATTKEIKIVVDSDPELVVWGDPNRLQQVIWNLLSNSVKFTDRGGEVRVRACREKSHARIDVQDTGRGIEREFLPYVFDRFRQAEAAATRRYGGLGLGLAIVRQITELHGGTVVALSEGVGKGATFSIRMPIPAMRRPLPESDPADADQAMPSLRGLSILLVEDDAASAQVLCTMLQRSGAHVRTERSVAAALTALREHLPDLLVSDIAMPQEDGFVLIRNVRSTLRISPERLPAIALSAFSDMNTRVNVLGAGFQRFLEKPVELVDLVKTVSDVARRR